MDPSIYGSGGPESFRYAPMHPPKEADQSEEQPHSHGGRIWREEKLLLPPPKQLPTPKASDRFRLVATESAIVKKMEPAASVVRVPALNKRDDEEARLIRSDAVRRPTSPPLSPHTHSRQLNVSDGCRTPTLVICLLLLALTLFLVWVFLPFERHQIEALRAEFATRGGEEAATEAAAALMRYVNTLIAFVHDHTHALLALAALALVAITCGRFTRDLDAAECERHIDLLVEESVEAGKVATSTLDRLNLASLAIDDKGIPRLATALQGLPDVVEMNLSRNDIGDSGVEMLCKAIGRGCCKGLTLLDLRDNYRLGDRGVIALANVLSKGTLPRLTTLHLSGNRMGTHAVEALIAACRATEATPNLKALFVDSAHKQQPQSLELLRACQARGNGMRVRFV